MEDILKLLKMNGIQYISDHISELEDLQMDGNNDIENVFDVPVYVLRLFDSNHAIECIKSAWDRCLICRESKNIKKYGLLDQLWNEPQCMFFQNHLSGAEMIGDDEMRILKFCGKINMKEWNIYKKAISNWYLIINRLEIPLDPIPPLDDNLTEAIRTIDKKYRVYEHFLYDHYGYYYSYQINENYRLFNGQALELNYFGGLFKTEWPLNTYDILRFSLLTRSQELHLHIPDFAVNKKVLIFIKKDEVRVACLVIHSLDNHVIEEYALPDFNIEDEAYVLFKEWYLAQIQQLRRREYVEAYRD